MASDSLARQAPGAIPTEGGSGGGFHALQGRFPRSGGSRGDSHRGGQLQRRIPRAPGVIPTVGRLQRRIPQGRFKKPQVRWGARFPVPWDLPPLQAGNQTEAIPTRLRGKSHGLQG